jgi:ABC-type oligopeptide transport system substrate-binding subunit
LFASKEVRQALSLAIDRNAIANAVVFESAATGFVPNRVFEAGASQ